MASGVARFSLRSAAALALLACAAPLQAVNSVRDSVPAATLLLPYFFVSRNGIQPGTPIPAKGSDTVFRVLNVGVTGLVVKVEVWNKYGSPVFGFSVPMAARDAIVGSLRDLLNGRLNVNPYTQAGSISSDPCGLNQITNIYLPTTGFGATTFIRFPNPSTSDAHAAISRNPTPAFSGPTLALILDSLDESSELTGFTFPPGPGVLDVDNPMSGTSADGALSGDFSGYLTLDVVNYCTQFTPRDPEWTGNDAIATAGWAASGYTPNALIGSYKYVDACGSAAAEFLPMPGLEFDATLGDWTSQKTFYGRFHNLVTDSGANASVPAAFRFVGDGRKPLGSSYVAEFQTGAGISSHLTIWRSDVVTNPGVANDVDVAFWYKSGGPQNFGFADAAHQLVVSTFDNDAQAATLGSPLYAYLQAQRYAFPDSDLNPTPFAQGWTSIGLPGGFYEQASVKTDRRVCSADPNGDGSVDVTDVFYLINFLFANGPAPK